MPLFILVLLCLIASFIFENRKMRVKSVVQLILALVLFFIVFFFLPNSPFEKVTENLLGQKYLYYIQLVLTDAFTKVSITKIIANSVVFLTFLSIFDIVVFVKEKIEVKRELVLKTSNQIKQNLLKLNKFGFENKIYLLFCRFLS